MSSLSIRDRQSVEPIAAGFSCEERQVAVQTIISDVIRQEANCRPDASLRERSVELQGHTSISKVAQQIIQKVRCSDHWEYFLQTAYVYPNGDLYIGERRGDLENGNGVMFYADETIYRGRWLDGKWSGKGTLTFLDGGFSTGHFLNGQLEGHGHFRSQSSFWIGMWHEGKLHGQAKGTIGGGEFVYNGEWKYGEPEGWGIAQGINYMYVGEWTEGIPNGWGRGIFPDGSVVEGIWVNGDLQAIGSRTFSWLQEGWDSLIVSRDQARAP